MKLARLVFLSLFISLFILVSFHDNTQAAEKTITWKLQSCAAESDLSYDMAKYMAKLIDEASGGRIKVKTFPVNALCALPDEFQAVKTGAIEMAHIVPVFSAGQVPSLLACDTPYAPGDVYQLWELFYSWGLKDIVEEEYLAAGVHFLTVVYGGHVYLGTTYPVNTIEDFKGKPYFLVGGQMFLQKLGAVQTDIPGFDYYMALKLGTVVGTSQAINFLESLKLKEVDKYYVKTAAQVAAGHMVINKKAWEKIGPELQMHIQDRIDANFFKCFLPLLEAEKKAEQSALEYGVKFLTLPPADEAKLRETAMSGWDEVATKSKGAAKAVRVLKSWVEYNK